jgi:hypothetical protein
VALGTAGLELLRALTVVEGRGAAMAAQGLSSSPKPFVNKLLVTVL